MRSSKAPDRSGRRRPSAGPSRGSTRRRTRCSRRSRHPAPRRRSPSAAASSGSRTRSPERLPDRPADERWPGGRQDPGGERAVGDHLPVRCRLGRHSVDRTVTRIDPATGSAPSPSSPVEPPGVAPSRRQPAERVARRERRPRRVANSGRRRPRRHGQAVHTGEVPGGVGSTATRRTSPQVPPSAHRGDSPSNTGPDSEPTARSSILPRLPLGAALITTTGSSYSEDEARTGSGPPASRGKRRGLHQPQLRRGSATRPAAASRR